jgi:hypothetical protein
LLRTLLEEVIIRVERAEAKAELTLRWRGGLITELAIDLPRCNPPPIRTEEETIDLVQRLAMHYPDATIAGILIRQGRKTATGQRFTAGGVGNLRRYWKIPRFQPSAPLSRKMTFTPNCSISSKISACSTNLRAKRSEQYQSLHKYSQYLYLLYAHKNQTAKSKAKRSR